MKRYSKKRSTSRYAKRRYIKKLPKAVRSKRIFRRFIRRKAVKPELKYIENPQGFDQIYDGGSNLGTSTYQVTPVNIGEGNGVGQRQGNQLNFIKFDFKYNIRGQVDKNTAGTYFNSSDNTVLVRVTFWTPRVTFTEANAYMSGIFNSTMINYNMVTVLRDYQHKLALPQFSTLPTGGTSVLLSGGFSTSAQGVTTIKFPRKVKFGLDADTAIDQEKYACFVTFTSKFNQFTSFHCDFDCKTWFFDS